MVPQGRARALAMIVAISTSSTAAWGQDAPETSQDTSEAAATDPDSSIGLTIELAFTSAYLFRGFNIFQDTSQRDQNAFLAPAVTWDIFDTGLTLGYWGAFQVTGDNVQGHIDSGLGAEQDLFLSWTYALPQDLSFSVGMFAYFYPAADEAVAGASVPLWLEPYASLSWSSVVDLSLSVAYLAGVQDVIRDSSYLYIQPSIGKSFPLHPIVSLDLAASFGVKIWESSSASTDNTYDVLVTLGVPISVVGPLTVRPALGAAWTNIGGLDFGDEAAFFGELKVGVSL